MDTGVAGRAAYTLHEEKSEVRYRWVIERADGSVCFRLARNEWSLAEEILHNLLHELGCDKEAGESHVASMRRGHRVRPENGDKPHSALERTKRTDSRTARPWLGTARQPDARRYRRRWRLCTVT